MERQLRNTGAWVVASLLIRFGITARAKKRIIAGECILSIYFHAPDSTLFEFCIKWLLDNGFTFISQKELYLVYKKCRPFPKQSVILTVDDGWQTNYDNIIPIANKYRVPVTIFVSTDAIENGCFWWSYIERALKTNIYNTSVEPLKRVPDNNRAEIVNKIMTIIRLKREALTPEQVVQVAASNYITIGSHTVSHPILPNCCNQHAYFELKASKLKIEEWVNKKVVYFSYPNGDFGDREIKYLKEIGYILAYTAHPAFITREKLSNIFELPRFCVHDNISNEEAICRMLGVWQRFIKNPFKISK
ncbi:MAG: polysaccharide deacetylase family protein [Ginsengibacter sp.]|jgi:peptidoglycan/xylan/chitin deacetylase (PgdA/CDA1 family)